MTMPRNIFRARAIGIFGNTLHARANDHGDPIPLLAPLNRTVTMADMSASNADLNQLYTKLNEFQAGLGDSLMKSDFKTESQIDFGRNIFALEYGLHDRVSLGLMVPISRQIVKSSFRAETTSQAAAVAKATAGMDVLTDGVWKADANKPTTATFEQAVFTAKGYEIPHDWRVEGLGDIELGLKYQALHTDDLQFSTQLGVRMPTTTHTENYARLLDKGLGDKQLDVGLFFYGDYNLNSNWILAGCAKFTAQLTHEIRRPFLYKGETGLPNLLDANAWDNVRRNLGDMIDTEISSTYHFGDRAFNVYGAYQFSLKAEDRISGGRTDLDYDAVEFESATRSHRYEAGIGYSTVQHYLKGRFFLPFELKYGFNSAFRARNTPIASYNRFNLLLYF